MSSIGRVADAMISYYAGDARRVNHFLKVFGFAKAIGELEGLDDEEMEILQIAALTHDIGIKNSEKKHGSASGHHQQTEGPPEAKKMLDALGLAPAVTERVCWLIAHHHTYDNIQGNDYQILIEADFLVNAFEGELSPASIRNMRDKLFKTNAGKSFLNQLYGF